MNRGAHTVTATGARLLALAPPARKHAVLTWLDARLDALQQRHGDVQLLCGGAEGFDAAAAVAAHHRGIPVILALPTKDYGRYWWGRRSVTGADRRAAFTQLEALAASTEVLFDEPKPNGVPAPILRNTWMADRTDDALAWMPTSRGTAHMMAELTRRGITAAVADDDLPGFRLVRGDLWRLHVDARVIPTNLGRDRHGRAVMGAGVAKDAAERVPEAAERLGAALASGAEGPVELGADPTGAELVALPTKRRWQDTADPQLLTEAAAELASLTDDRGWSRVGLPWVGAGHGGLAKAEVWALLEPHLDARFTLVDQ